MKRRDQGNTRSRKTVNWRLAYSFRRLDHDHHGGEHTGCRHNATVGTERFTWTSRQAERDGVGGRGSDESPLQKHSSSDEVTPTLTSSHFLIFLIFLSFPLSCSNKWAYKVILVKPPQMRLASFQHRVSLQEGLPKGTPCFFGFQFIDIAKEAEANRGSKKKWTQENLMMRKNQSALIQKKEPTSILIDFK